jgi:hypothetical protein
MTTIQISIDRSTRGYPFLVKEQLNDNNEVINSTELSFMEADSLNYSFEEYFEEVKAYLVEYSQSLGTYFEEASLDRRDFHINAISLLRYLENYLEPLWAAEWQSRDSASESTSD